MIRNLFTRTAIAIVLILTGCSAPPIRVATHVNNREFYYARYIEECVEISQPIAPPGCAAFRIEVNRYKRVIEEAYQANERGGKYPLQLKEMAKQLERVKRARGN
jgi:hypothetical protein